MSVTTTPASTVNGETTPAPRVSVVLPVLDEGACLDDALRRLRGQTWTELEILVADGGSSDDTRAIVERHRRADPRVRLVDNPRRLQSAGLNACLPEARGSILVRVDGHSFVEPDYVARCVELIDSTGAAVVGGRMAARPDDRLVARGVAVANEALWGAGPARFHRTGEGGPAETVYLGTFRRDVVDALGGWSEDVGVNEDYELNHRIRAAGGVVWFDPTLAVGYRPRSSLRAVARQYFRYGRSKATVMRRHPRSIRLRQVVPAAMLPVAGLVALGGWPAVVAGGLVASHAVVVAGGAALSDGPWPARAVAAAAAWSMHWSWSAGVWFGLVRPFAAAADQNQTRPPS